MKFLLSGAPGAAPGRLSPGGGGRTPNPGSPVGEGVMLPILPGVDLGEDPFFSEAEGSGGFWLWLTAHFRMCFSRVEATEKGISQNRHLKMSLPNLPWVLMCLVSLELWAHA